jgi:hypothetical protein
VLIIVGDYYSLINFFFFFYQIGKAACDNFNKLTHRNSQKIILISLLRMF